MLIKVTKEDIEGAGRASYENCPVARALNRLGLGPARVEYEAIYLGDQFRRLPDDVSRLIREYDKTGRMKPFTFTLETEEK